MLAKELEGKVRLYNKGESKGVGNIKDAIWEGFTVAMDL
jgi:hypothetical protein